jgi:hypothetical protein
MAGLELDVTEYGLYSSLEGQRQTASVMRRGSKRVITFSTRQFAPESAERNDEQPARALPGLFLNLNEVQRRTWKLFLLGSTVAAVARAERVSRQAIYERVRGKNGRGGMIEKNFWVCFWWLMRQELYDQLA